MIRLTIRKHCKDCPQFYPTVDTLWENDKPIHYVTCSNKDMCYQIRRYLRDLDDQKIEEEFDDECGSSDTDGDM